MAAQWAFLETELDNLLSIFLAKKKVKKLKLSNKPSFKIRINNLKKAAVVLQRKHKKDLKELIEILKDASSLHGDRDDVIHGKWMLKRKGVNLLPEIITVKSIPAYRYRGIKFTSKKAEELAVRISRVTLRVNEWRIKYVNNNQNEK